MKKCMMQLAAAGGRIGSVDGKAPTDQMVDFCVGKNPQIPGPSGTKRIVNAIPLKIDSCLAVGGGGTRLIYCMMQHPQYYSVYDNQIHDRRIQ